MVGLSENLDELRRCHEGMDDYLGMIVTLQLRELPDFIHECGLMYIPQVNDFPYLYFLNVN